MVLAADYPFLDVFWTMILFFCWVAWIWMMILILSDVFRREMSGWAKAAWCLFLIVLPFLGALDLPDRRGQGDDRAPRQDAQVSQASFDDYVRKVAADGGSTGEIARAKELLDSGAINAEEFEPPQGEGARLSSAIRSRSVRVSAISLGAAGAYRRPP